MRKEKVRPVDIKYWKRYEEENEELYSHLKKKGKHQRAEKKCTNK